MEGPPAKKRRHRFQRVEERVSNLQTELTLHAKTAGAVDEASVLSFKEELSLQAELTTLDAFQFLFRSLQPLVTTTPQLLHHLPKVVKKLRLELKQAREESQDLVVQRQRLVPVLKLVAALARELGKEFYPHFADVLPLVVAVIDTKDPELSTQVFKTLTMVFNYLRVQLLADMDAVHKCYFPLLGHTREFVRNFAAQTLAVLLRRLDSPKAMRKYLKAYLTALVRGSGRSNEELKDGSAKLLFQLVKNVNHGFHSRMKEVLLFLLGSFRPKETHDADETELGQQEAVYEIVQETCGLMMKHTDAEHSGEMLEYLVFVVTKVITMRRGKGGAPTAADDLYLSRVLRVLLIFSISRVGRLVSGATNSKDVRIPSVHEVCASLVSPDNKVLTSSNEELRDVVIKYFEAMWRLFPAEDAVISSQVKAVFTVAAEEDKNASSHQKLLEFVDQVLQNPHVTVHFIVTFLLPNAMRFGIESLAKTDIGAFSRLLCQLGDYVAEHDWEISESVYLVPSKTNSRRWSFSFQEISSRSDSVLMEGGRDLLQKCFEDDNDTDTLALGWKFCKTLELVDLDAKKLEKFVSPVIAKCDKRLKGEASSQVATLRAELRRLQQVSMYQSKNISLTMKYVREVLRGNETSLTTISTLLMLVDMEPESRRYEILNAEAVVRVANSLLGNLRSPAHELRLATLQLLARFKRFEFIDTGSETLSGPCDLLDVTVELESACKNVTVATEREVIRLLTRVKILCRSPQTPDIYKKIALNHLHGLYNVKFSTIWPHVADAVETAARQNFNEFWPCMGVELLAASIRHEDSNSHTSEDYHISEHGDIIEEFEHACMQERGQVVASTATDAATHHMLLWKGLAKFVDLVEAKTKFMVPLFLTFLRDQYRVIYADELDAKRLEDIDQALLKLEDANADELPNWRSQVEFQGLTTKTVRGKFVDQLKLFSIFRNMKGAYAQQLLHAIFFDLLMKSDEVISKLALQCLYAFGSKALVSYKTQLNRLADSASFREELTSFKVGEGDGIVLREHRSELLPILLRLLYSKCVSKKGRNTGDTVAARRAAILAYLAALEASELASFVELVVRAFNVTVDVPDMAGESTSIVTGEVQPVAAVAQVQSSRVMGFLNLLQDLIGQLGVKLAVFVPQIANVLLAILQTSIDSNEDDDVNVKKVNDDEDDDENEVSSVETKRKVDGHSTKEVTTASMKKQIRMLTYRRLAEVIDTFDTLVHLQPWVMALLDTSREAIMHLPKAVIGADKASALLEVLVAMGRADRARQWIPEPLILNVISCLSAGLASSRGVSPEILDALLQFMDSLLDGDEQLIGEDESMTAANKNAKMLLIPHIDFVLEQFVLRFQSKAARYVSDRYAGSSKKELAFLCRLSHHLDAATGDVANAAHDLFQLLLPFLLRNHQTSPKDKENLLEVLANLVPKLSEPKKHVLALARLLAPGPNCIADRDPRQKLVLVFAALGSHSSLKELSPVADLLEELNAYDSKHIEETDYERRLVALNRLNTSRFAGFTEAAHLLAPLVAQCLQCMHDSEFAVRSAALASLTTFLTLSAEVAEVQKKQSSDANPPVLNSLESLVMPCLRGSLRSTDENARRGFVTLLGFLADHSKAFRGYAFVPTDLVLARNQEDPEADFFYNITHIQAHRRRRALQRLGALMNEMADKFNAQEEELADDAAPQWFSNSTVNGIILPLVLHFVYETHAKSQESLCSEAAACVGSAAGLLGWSHYLSLLRRLLKSIDGHIEMESAIILSICSVVDHFHFEAPGAATEWRSNKAQNDSKPTTPVADAMETSSKVQDNMETQVLPMLYSYLFKSAGDRKSSKRKADDNEVSSAEAVSVRVPLALAVVKVLRRLRADTFHRELPKLLLRFANLLKSKDEAIRVSARSTLVKVAVELGARFLLPIVEELRHTLRDGYMVHVLSFTVHALLVKLPEILAAHGPLRKPQSLLLLPKDKQEEAHQEAKFSSPLDGCIPSLMEMLAAELFQGMATIDEAAEAAAGGVERKAAHKSKMKEARASGGRSLDSIELLARSLPFLPNPSIHAVVSALVRRFQATDAGAQATGALQEGLKRVALGLAKNPAVEPSYVFLYAYNLLDSSLESFRPISAREKEQYAAAGSTTTLVTSWLVSEKSAAATKLLAKRVKARDTVRVTMQQQVTGFDKLRQQQQSKSKKKRREEAAALAAESTAHIKELLNFGVFLVFSFLRRSSSSSKEQDGEGQKSFSSSLAPAQLVDPLVPLLMRCTGEARTDRAVITSLKCLGSLLPRQEELPAIRVARTPLLDRLFKILQKAGAATRNEMVQTCYRTLTALLKQQQGLELAQQNGSAPSDAKSETLRLTEPQLRVLLSFLRADLDEQDHQNATFALLKAIVNSHLVISEVYDVMLRVGELLVQSDSPSARTNCATIYLTFVLEYPLGNKRLSRHLKFLVDNLSYGHATGRCAVLEAMRALLSKLPQDLVNERSQFFFLPLVLRLANDEAPECRDLARTALTTLVRRLGNKELNENVLLVGTWWTQASKSDAADAMQLLATAAQITTLILETRPEFFERTAAQVLASARIALERSLQELQAVDDSSQVRWQSTFHICTAITAFSNHLTGPFELWLEDPKSTKAFLDEVVLPLMQYPHAWVRLATTKLLTSYLSRRHAKTLAFSAPIKRLPADSVERLHHGAVYMERPGRLFSWASALCKLLEAPGLSDDLATEVLTAMPFLCEALEARHDIPQDMSATSADAVATVEDDVEEAEIEEEDAATSEDKEDLAEDDEELQRREEEEKKEERAKARTPVGWLLTRLSYVARGSNCSNEVQAVVFKLFAALLHKHDAAFAQQYVVQFINPLYRASSKLEEIQAQQEQMKLQQQQRARHGHKSKRSGHVSEPIAPPESALLAQEVLQLLEQKLGATPFLEAYSFVQRKLASARAARKLQRRAEAVADPQRAAQRRMQKNEQKRLTKQLRKRKHAVLKGSASAAVRPAKVLRPGAE